MSLRRNKAVNALELNLYNSLWHNRSKYCY